MGDGLKINEIGYLPQQTALQRDFPASVEEIVMSGFLGRMGLRPFYTKAEKKEASTTHGKNKNFPIWLLVVTESFPVDSSRECFLPEPYVLREKSFFWHDHRFPAWIRWQLRICIRLSVN